MQDTHLWMDMRAIISIAFQVIHKMGSPLLGRLGTFQRLVMYIFIDLLFKSMIVFVDDFSTHSNASDYLQCVREALIRYRKMHLALNLDKTFLGVNRGVLLWYVVSEKGKEPDPEKIKAVSGLATLTNANEIAKSLGHVGDTGN
jgi:hypothetical protein